VFINPYIAIIVTSAFIVIISEYNNRISYERGHPAILHNNANGTAVEDAQQGMLDAHELVNQHNMAVTDVSFSGLISADTNAMPMYESLNPADMTLTENLAIHDMK
jgi:hypothetical protein